MESTYAANIRRPENTSTMAVAHPSWYHATTLSERLERSPELQLTENDENVQQAVAFLKKWKLQPPFDKGDYFVERLSADRMDEQTLFTLLAEPITTVQARLGEPDPPAWLSEILHLLAEKYDFSDFDRILQQLEQKEQEGCTILRPFFPLLQNEIRRVQVEIHELASTRTSLPFDPERTLALLFMNLVNQLVPKISRTFVLELNIARLRGRLKGEEPQQRFQYYLQLLSQQDELTNFLAEYCVLARQIPLTGKLWANCSIELLQRLCKDWPDILTQFSPEQDPGLLCEAAGGAGDTHRNGHSVMILTFQSGFRLLYKPKSLAVDAHFQDLLRWLNKYETHPGFRTLKLLAREQYGWTEFVSVATCSSEEEVKRFYERQGGYLALLHALNAVDVHAENIIAAGEHPILIDLEALFHPYLNQVISPVSEMFIRPATKAIDQSVLRIALLPQRFWTNNGSIGVDISGLGNAAGQLNPRPVPQWEAIGTDEMRLILEQVTLQGSNNRPTLHGQDVQTLNYLTDLLKGFTTIYRLLIQQREMLLNDLLPRFADDEIRFLARATRTYAILLTESFHPNMLRNMLKRERFFDRLWGPVVYQPYLKRLIAAERSDLLRGDIPMFVARADSHDLLTSQGTCIKDFFAVSSLEQVYRHIQQLNEADLQRHLWFIRASFLSIFDEQDQKFTDGTHFPQGKRARAGKKLPDAVMQHELSRELLKAASDIGDRLEELAVYDNGLVDWYGPETFSLSERAWSIKPVGIDLADGLPGIILFSGYLGAHTGQSRYTNLAHKALATLVRELEQVQQQPARSGKKLLQHLGSCIYLFAHLSVLWKDQALLCEAEKLTPLLMAQVENDVQLDLLTGTAGALMSLLSLYKVSSSKETLDLAMKCANHLLQAGRTETRGIAWQLSGQDKPYVGLAHGVEGMVWSLAQLATLSQQKWYQEIMPLAVPYNDSLLPKLSWNRKNVRASYEGTLTQVSNHGLSWDCGLIGIALGYLGVLQQQPDNVDLRAETQRILDVLTEIRSANHTLGDGATGVAEVLLIAEAVFPEQKYREQRHHIVHELVTQSKQQCWRLHVPLDIEVPGMLHGLAGIGYELLRLARPQAVPSILMLNSPI